MATRASTRPVADFRSNTRDSGELGAQPSEAGANAALDRALRLLERDRNLAVGETAKIGELDGEAFLVGEDAQRIAHVLGDGHVPYLVLEVVARLGPLPVLALFAGATRRVGTDGVDGAPMAVRQEERPKRPALRVELVRRIPQAEEDLLHDLLGARAVAEEPTSEAEHGTGMAPVGLGQGVLAPASDGDDESGVARLRQVVSHQHSYDASVRPG